MLEILIRMVTALLSISRVQCSICNCTSPSPSPSSTANSQQPTTCRTNIVVQTTTTSSYSATHRHSCSNQHQHHCFQSLFSNSRYQMFHASNVPIKPASALHFPLFNDSKTNEIITIALTIALINNKFELKFEYVIKHIFLPYILMCKCILISNK